MAGVMRRIRTVWGGVAGAPYYSNHYFNEFSTTDSVQEQIDAVDTLWTALSGNIANTVSWEVEAVAAVIDVSTGVLVRAVTGTRNTGAGTYTGDQLPRQVQGLITWDTGVVVSGRFLRGRTFIPGIGEPINSAGGVPSTAFVTLLSTAGNSLIGDGTPELVIWSRTHGVAEPAVTASGSPQWATLNSRRD